MLKKIDDLPPNVIGVRAEGKLTRDDYEKTFTPLLDDAYLSGHRVRFLYQLGEEFSGFTAGAALDDFRLGLKYLRLFERCAIVTEVEWVRNAARFFGSLFPCPVQVFKNSQFKEAVDW